MLFEEAESFFYFIINFKKKKTFSRTSIHQVLDTDGGGTLSRLELEAALEEDAIMNVFTECDIPLEEAFELYDLIDRDQTGELDIDEFLGACSRIRGNCKSKDVRLLRGRNLDLN